MNVDFTVVILVNTYTPVLTMVKLLQCDKNYLIIIIVNISNSFITYFYNLVFTALHVMQTRYSEANSVCLSVRLSVRPSVCHTRDP